MRDLNIIRYMQKQKPGHWCMWTACSVFSVQFHVNVLIRVSAHCDEYMHMISVFRWVWSIHTKYDVKIVNRLQTNDALTCSDTHPHMHTPPSLQVYATQRWITALTPAFSTPRCTAGAASWIDSIKQRMRRDYILPNSSQIILSYKLNIEQTNSF